MNKNKSIFVEVLHTKRVVLDWNSATKTWADPERVGTGGPEASAMKTV